MIDFDAWSRGDGPDVQDPRVIANLRYRFWRDEALEVATRNGLPTDEGFLDQLAQDLMEREAAA